MGFEILRTHLIFKYGGELRAYCFFGFLLIRYLILLIMEIWFRFTYRGPFLFYGWILYNWNWCFFYLEGATECLEKHVQASIGQGLQQKYLFLWREWSQALDFCALGLFPQWKGKFSNSCWIIIVFMGLLLRLSLAV